MGKKIRPDYREVPIRGGRTVAIPRTWATEGYSAGMYNFAGPGWNSTEGAMAARPVDTLDFAAKLHDLSYCISDIGFKTVDENLEDVKNGRGSARERSLQHKADLIFRIMVQHTGNRGAAAVYSRLKFSHERKEFARAGDGFVNILNEPNLVWVLKKYHMMPWSELPAANQVRHRGSWFSRRVHGSPNYAAWVPQDEKWYEWAKKHYAKVWMKLLAVR